jgi:hypothetical protein
VWREIVGQADSEAVEGFRQAVQQAGKSSKEGQGMWASSKFEGMSFERSEGAANADDYVNADLVSVLFLLTW